MKAGLQSFIFSLFSLIPVVGLGFIVPAVAQGRRAIKLLGSDWNPVGAYLTAARWLTVVGFLVSCASLAALFVVVSEMVEGAGYGCALAGGLGNL